MTDGAENNRKGHWFEKQFAAYMVEHMGFSEAKVNPKLNGKTAVEAYEIDILGLKKNRFWTAVWMLAILGFFLAEIAVVAPRLSSRVTSTATAMGTRVQKAARLPSPVVGIAIIGLGFFVVGLVGDRRSRRRIWVECKNRQSTIVRADIYALMGKVDDVRARVGRNRIDAVWYVSTAPYHFDAVAVAEKKGVTLFIAVETPTGLSFERVS